jgi:hypothetical protein
MASILFSPPPQTHVSSTGAEATHALLDADVQALLHGRRLQMQQFFSLF